MYISKGH